VAEPQPPEGPGLSKPQGKGQTPRLSREAKGIIRPSNPQGNSDRAPWAAEAPPKGGKGLWVRGRGGGGVRRGCHSAVAELPLATDGDFFLDRKCKGFASRDNGPLRGASYTRTPKPARMRNFFKTLVSNVAGAFVFEQIDFTAPQKSSSL